MTKSTITRERLQEIADDGFLKHGESKVLARMALAAMDSEPVAWRWRWSDDVEGYWRYTEEQRETHGSVTAQPLYRHAQPVVPNEITSASAPEVFEIAAEAERLGLRGTYASYAVGWNACRADMLQELQKSAGVSNNCRSNEKLQDQHVESLTTIKAAPALDSLPKNAESRSGNSPVIPDGYVMVPKELSCEMDDASWEAYHNTRCMSDIWDALLSLAPQLPGSEPATVPGKWIPVSEQLPDPKSAQRVCVYTPTPHEDMRYRFVPASLFRAVCSDATHWYYMGPPAAPQEPKP
ncbi:hypothetical protein AAFL38_28690 [Klebsiella grimontii]|uniref:DUF551 domain-containing protein n=1 Tax=Klebsiella grimontii TaxID=2058152 RepID=A0ABU9PAZ7_9ENTR|nr:hypothetical protein [Klebsiella grimontii]